MKKFFLFILILLTASTYTDAQTYRKFIDVNGDLKEDRLRGSLVSNDTIWFNSLSVDQDEVVYNLSCYNTNGEFINQTRVETSPQFGQFSLFKIGNRLLFLDDPIGTGTIRLREYNSSTLELLNFYTYKVFPGPETIVARKIIRHKDHLIISGWKDRDGFLYILNLDDLSKEGQVIEYSDPEHDLYVISDIEVIEGNIHLVAVLSLYGDAIISFQELDSTYQIIKEIRTEEAEEVHDNPWIEQSPTWSNITANNNFLVDLNRISTRPQSRDFGYIQFDSLGVIEDYYVHFSPYASGYSLKRSIQSKDGSIYLYGQVGISISEDGPITAAPLPPDRWNIFVPYIIKVTDGEMEWERIYIRLDENGNNDFNALLRLHETEDGLIGIGVGNIDPEWFIEENGKYGDFYIIRVNEDGCFDQDDCLEGDWLQLTDTEEQIEPKLQLNFPNPVNDFIDVSQLQVKKIEVFDTSGKKIISSNEKRINVSLLQAGIYIITLHFDGFIETRKIIKN
jgi:hypothetical protein